MSFLRERACRRAGGRASERGRARASTGEERGERGRSCSDPACACALRRLATVGGGGGRRRWAAAGGWRLAAAGAQPAQALLEVGRLEAAQREREVEAVERAGGVGQLGRVDERVERLVDVGHRLAVLHLELLVGERLDVAHQRRMRAPAVGLQRAPPEEVLDLEEGAQQDPDRRQRQPRLALDPLEDRIEAVERVEVLDVLHVRRRRLVERSAWAEDGVGGAGADAALVVGRVAARRLARRLRLHVGRRRVHLRDGLVVKVLVRAVGQDARRRVDELPR
eukprot:2508103-Prymnesium_polylepis.1